MKNLYENFIRVDFDGDSPIHDKTSAVYRSNPPQNGGTPDFYNEVFIYTHRYINLYPYSPVRLLPKPDVVNVWSVFIDVLSGCGMIGRSLWVSSLQTPHIQTPDPLSVGGHVLLKCDGTRSVINTNQYYWHERKHEALLQV